MSHLARGDDLTCTVTVYDGIEMVTDSVTTQIGNAPPDITNIGWSNPNLFAGSIPDCVWTAEDPDGDADNSELVFYVNGVPHDQSEFEIDVNGDAKLLEWETSSCAV